MTQTPMTNTLFNPMLVLGTSGSGVSTALELLNEFDFLPIDRVPATQLQAILDRFDPDTPLALGLSLVSDSQESLLQALSAAMHQYPQAALLCLDASEAQLLSRYQQAEKSTETVKAFWSEQKALLKTLNAQRQAWEPRFFAINTEGLSRHAFKLKLAKLLGVPMQNDQMNVLIESFGFKHGMPADADVVLDIRFLTNPFYRPDLRPLTGLDRPIAEYLEALPATQPFLQHAMAMLETMLPAYCQEGKTRLKIAVGCTGGQHRSVYVAQRLGQFLKNRFQSAPEAYNNKEVYNITVNHREQHHWPSVPVA